MHSVYTQTKAQESRSAIERLYIAMRHLFIRGSYKPMGVSGEALREAMMTLKPEIYGSIDDPERVELDGLLYIFQRLPLGIEECRFIRFITREGYEHSNFPILIPPKRRRNCYRIDEEQMFIEMTRGRSDIYDVLTHLTFMYIEAEKIRKNSTDYRGRQKREWMKLEEIVLQETSDDPIQMEVAYTYLSSILNRSYHETVEACKKFEDSEKVNNLFHIVYYLGKLSMDEALEEIDREISFSTLLRERIGHHTFGEKWAQSIKFHLMALHLLDRPIHIISANMHSVMNCVFSRTVFENSMPDASLEDIARELSISANAALRQEVEQVAADHGMVSIPDSTGTNIPVQIIDMSTVDLDQIHPEIKINKAYIESQKPVIIVMDYAFGEQAYEAMDELLKPFKDEDEKEYPLKVESIAIMGKAGILCGDKGDIMIADSHVFEGTADNYPLENVLRLEDFAGQGLKVYQGSMITVLGTSLQNKDILSYFHNSSWRAVGLEMEGAHYQKAIQAASKIRGSIHPDVQLMYAYYASDNPLISGQTLASGALGLDGVKPTYLITKRILEVILNPQNG
jgi:hypothetical protein